MQVDLSRDDPKPKILLDQGQKVIVTDFGLAHWLAQTFKIELNEMGHLKPNNLTA